MQGVVFRGRRLVQRNLMVYKHSWTVIFSGFFEPIFYLFGLGFGLGKLVGSVSVGGHAVPYAAFIAPALLAVSAMNGGLTDGFFNVFFKLNYQKTYEGVLATPLTPLDICLGEMTWAMIRGSIYAAGFLIITGSLGLLRSPWALLAFPAAVLASGAFSAGALLVTSFVKRVEDFDLVMGVIVNPMFLFAGTFFPISVYPAVMRPIVQMTPLYHAVALLRGLTIGSLQPVLLVHAGYLAAMWILAITIAARRFRALMIR